MKTQLVLGLFKDMIGMKRCFLLLVSLTCLSVSASFGQSDSVEAWRKRYPEWTQTAQFFFSFYRWPELKPLKRTPEMDRIGADLLAARANSYVCGGPEIYEAARFGSKYFRCTFLLGYILSQDVMLGGGPPSTPMFAITTDSNFIYSFDEQGRGAREYWPGELRHHVRFLESIGELENLDSSAAIGAALDAVAALSTDHPLLILDSLWDIYVFSNAVADTNFWDSLNDAGLELLTRPVLRNVANDPGVSRHDAGEYGNRLEYDKQKSHLYPVVPPFAVHDGDETLVRLYSWSPCNCTLYRWLIAISIDGKLYVEKAQVTQYIGYCFTYY